MQFCLIINICMASIISTHLGPTSSDKQGSTALTGKHINYILLMYL